MRLNIKILIEEGLILVKLVLEFFVFVDLNSILKLLFEIVGIYIFDLEIEVELKCFNNFIIEFIYNGGVLNFL